MKRLFTAGALTLAALTVGGAALADATLEHFQGTIPFPGGARTFTVPLNRDTHYEFHMHSKSPGARFGLRLFRSGVGLVAEQPANGHEKVEMEYTPVASGTYFLVVRAETGVGEFKGNLKLDHD